MDLSPGGELSYQLLCLSPGQDSKISHQAIRTERSRYKSGVRPGWARLLLAVLFLVDDVSAAAVVVVVCASPRARALA